MDRNHRAVNIQRPAAKSLSARRAWIEIRNGETLSALACVALRKESVDRNKYVVQCRKMLGGRSPQGERG